MAGASNSPFVAISDDDIEDDVVFTVIEIQDCETRESPSGTHLMKRAQEYTHAKSHMMSAQQIQNVPLEQRQTSKDPMAPLVDVVVSDAEGLAFSFVPNESALGDPVSAWGAAWLQVLPLVVADSLGFRAGLGIPSEILVRTN